MKRSSSRRAKELAHLEKRLLDERRLAVRELERAGTALTDTRHSAGGDPGAYSLHMADEGSDATEHEKALFLASREGRFLSWIDDALRRLYQAPESFGFCQRCGAAIVFERLDVVPHARFCLACKQHEERLNP